MTPFSDFRKWIKGVLDKDCAIKYTKAFFYNFKPKKMRLYWVTYKYFKKAELFYRNRIK